MVIRTDAGPEIGYGHAMRCLALAQAAEDWRIQLVYHECPDSVLDQYRQADVKIICYEGDLHGSDDAAFVAGMKPDWVVSDGYEFGADFYSGVCAMDPALLCIDDEGRSEVNCADAILNQNAGADPEWYGERKSDCRLMCGVEFTLLREEFCGVQREPKSGGWKRLLVTTGGADDLKVTLPIVDALAPALPDGGELLVVIGGANADREHLVEVCAGRGGVIALTDVSNMSEILQGADLVVTGAGSTVWECLALGVPFVTMTLAANQEFNAKYLADQDLAPAAGWPTESGFMDRLRQLVERLRHEPAIAKNAAERGRRLIDGRGTERVLASLAE